MAQAVEFGSKQAANDFRDRVADYLAASDDRRSKTVTFGKGTPESILSRAETQGFTTRKAASGGAGMSKLSPRERESLKRQHRTFSWRKYGFEAMRAKAALERKGVTEWQDYYEPGEGVAGALKNLEASKGQVASTGASLGVGGDYTDEEEISGVRQQQAQVERASAGQVDRAKPSAFRGDRGAIGFLREEERFDDDLYDIYYGDVDEYGRPLPSGRDYEELQDVHEERGPRSVALDNMRHAPVTRDPLQWAADPTHYDFPGLDTLDPELVHESRSARAQGMDESRSAPLADSPEQWAADPGHLDLPGVDAPSSTGFSAPSTGQAGLGGGMVDVDPQATFDVEVDVRQAQGRGSKVEESAAAEFGIDDRALDVRQGFDEAEQEALEIFGGGTRENADLGEAWRGMKGGGF